MIRATHLLMLVGSSVVIAIIIVSTCGEACIRRVDSFDAKILLILFFASLLLLIVLQIYFATFLGSALRTTKSCIAFCKIGLSASVSVPWTLYVTGRISSDPELRLLATFSDAGFSSVFSLAISMLALYFFNERYIYLSMPGNRGWAGLE